MSSFDKAWEEIVQFADSTEFVATLTQENRNQIRTGEAGIEVRNMDTQNWRTIPKEDFQYGYQKLQSHGQIQLKDIEPELAGRKSIVLAILARALDLEYQKRPVTVVQ